MVNAWWKMKEYFYCNFGDECCAENVQRFCTIKLKAILPDLDLLPYACLNWQDSGNLEIVRPGRDYGTR